MKKILFLSIALVLSSACLAKNGKMTINGTVADSTLNGKYVYVSNLMETGTAVVVDSCKVENFKFNYIVDVSKFIALQLSSDRYFISCFLEEGLLDVKLDSISTVSGGLVNKAYSEMDDSILKITDYYTSLYTAAPDDEKKAISDALDKERGSCLNRYLVSNIDNNLGLFLLLILAPEIELDQLKVLVAKSGEKAAKLAPLQNIIKKRENELIVVSNVMFIDFNGVNPEGAAVKLSDYVGKGKYVLVDFWASWCGPCRALVPDLKQLYEQYKDKGLVFLGINVMDKKDDFEKAFKELEMPWDQICVFDNKTVTLDYGITSIPQLILFAPDGKIVERKIHGEALKAKLVEIYKEK